MPVYISFSAPVEKKKKKKVWINSWHSVYYNCLTAHPVFMSTNKAISIFVPFFYVWWCSPSAMTLEYASKLPLCLIFSFFFFFFIASSALVCRLLPIPCQHTYLCWSMCTSDIIFTFKYLIMCFFLIICNQQESWLAPKDNLDISSKLQNEFQNQCCVHWISI